MQYSPNYQLKLPEASDVVNIADLNNNFMVLDDIIKTGIEQFMKNVYPVGSVYINATDDRNPNEILGFGTWQRIGNGRTLIDASSSRQAGTTGGAETVTLTAAQSGVPQHTHNYNMVNSPSGGTSITIANLPKNYASFTVRKVFNGGNTYLPGAFALSNSSVADSSRRDIAPVDYYTNDSYTRAGSTITLSGSGSAHTHTIGTTAVASANNTAANASQAHNNMPPYLAVYIWKRTA